mmetsp:Transcript_5628/g.10734  ORF Transcript_5628/g.10734 Transcript_5628/m.10734 type:complete len:224 (-) Transcript_5628:581-1252(-)
MKQRCSRRCDRLTADCSWEAPPLRHSRRHTSPWRTVCGGLTAAWLVRRYSEPSTVSLCWRVAWCIAARVNRNRIERKSIVGRTKKAPQTAVGAKSHPPKNPADDANSTLHAEKAEKRAAARESQERDSTHATAAHSTRRLRGISSSSLVGSTESLARLRGGWRATILDTFGTNRHCMAWTASEAVIGLSPCSPALRSPIIRLSPALISTRSSPSGPSASADAD